MGIVHANSSDEILGIFGNANLDDTIDEKDIAYVEGVINATKPRTNLSDANYDGTTDVKDIDQIRMIIDGVEKELTIVQYLGIGNITEKPVKVNKPINRIVVVGGNYVAEALCIFGEQDKVVGVVGTARMPGELKTFLSEIPLVGESSFNWDMEKIIELKPDLVLALSYQSYPDYEKQLKVAGIPLIQMDFYQPGKNYKEFRNLGWLLHKKERAEKLVNFEQQHINIIQNRIVDLNEDKKLRVYFESYNDYKTVGPGSGDHDTIIACGGLNIFADASSKSPEIDPEAVIARNPQIIIKTVTGSTLLSGYDAENTSTIEDARNNIIKRPGWDHIDAVKNGRVYIISTDSKSTHPSIYQSYIAKWFYPKLFLDMDPEVIHKEWMKEFLGIDFKGVYAYPLTEGN
jgi:iron complex transport system substrate-binding protein